ncbi:MAG: anthranilate synthase component 1 [Cardiobacteriaceae bacterium]|nr:anthranilate synthase component 1 [Cardiobacteriaceae bacterium]
MQQPHLHVHSKAVDYHHDLAAVFAALCPPASNALLLESAEISSKNSLQSLLLINAALKITCHGARVSFTALSANGAAVLPQLAAQLQTLATLEHDASGTLHATFAPLADGLDEDSKLQAATVFDGLRAVNALYHASATPVFLGGLFAYDLVRQFMPMDDITLEDDGLRCPDYVFYLAEHLLRLDHPTQHATLQTFCFAASEQEALQQRAAAIARQLQDVPALAPAPPADSAVTASLDDDAFKAVIHSLKHHIHIGDVFQIVPSRRFAVACPSPLAAYRQLKRSNPSPYMFYMQDEDFTLFGASPESALKYSPDTRQVEIYPIAGSRPRGFDADGNIDPELDARLELDMRLDHKELAEHLMLVDLARNDVARVCQSGSRRVADLMQVDRYSHIMHLVSRVVGKLRPELDALHAYQACMNMGTLTGAPKIRAMQLIYQCERHKRHSYGGAVGYLTSDGHFDTCIVIRSAFVQHGTAHIQAGCGTVLDSDPQAEADETRHKARAVINAIVHTHRA